MTILKGSINFYSSILLLIKCIDLHENNIDFDPLPPPPPQYLKDSIVEQVLIHEIERKIENVNVNNVCIFIATQKISV